MATPDPSESRWATTVVLGDGSTAFIRPLVPADQADLLAFHQAQSRDSIYKRYFSPKPHLTTSELEHFTNVDMVDRVALAVEVHDEFAGWCSYERWPGRDEAEAAFMVDDRYHGLGIATLMLEHLAAIARANGIQRFTAEVLSDNRGMLAVFAKAGWPLQRRFDSGVVDLDWELAATEEFIDTVERREQRADSRAVARILLPRAIAIVGASDREGSAGNLLWHHVRSSVSVPVYPVNPRLEDLDGVRCFGSVADLPAEVSLAIIAVPFRSLEATIDRCIGKKMRGAVIITTPDGSEGSPEVDITSMVARARRNGLRLIGPSSMGVASLNADSALQAAVLEVTVPAGGVAVSMQSGSLGASLLRRAHDVDLGLSWFVSLGDKSDISANDLLQFWEDDQFTRVIGLYTESFGNPRKFARIARRVGRTKPIVAVRTGAAADGELGGALYQQAGLIEVPTVHALLDTCRVLESQPVLRGPRLAVITNSASPGTLASAAMTAAGLVPVPTDRPLNWRSGPDDYRAAIKQADADADIDGMLVVYAPPVPGFEAEMGPAIAEAADGSSKPVVAVMIGSGDGWVAGQETVPSFAFPEQAVAVLASSRAYGRWLETEANETPVESRAVDPGRAGDLVAFWLEAQDDPRQGVRLDIEATSDLLATYSIALAAAREATPQSAASVADQIGFPVAVKSTKRASGRSARAGVALDLSSSDEVDEAVTTMIDSLGDDAQTLIVQEMITPGVDIRIRCHRDDRLGVIVSVGYGGIDADLIGDRTSRLAPLSPASASAMLNETKVGDALVAAGLDSSPLVDVIVLAAQLCADQHDVHDLDLNPVIVSDGQAIVTDATIWLVDVPNDDGPLRRLD